MLGDIDDFVHSFRGLDPRRAKIDTA